MESLAVCEHLHPALGPCSLQLPGEKPTPSSLHTPVSLFPSRAVFCSGLSTLSPPVAGSPHLQAVKGDRVPAVTVTAPHVPDICMGGQCGSQGLGWEFHYLFHWLNWWLGYSDKEESAGLPVGR